MTCCRQRRCQNAKEVQTKMLSDMVYREMCPLRTGKAERYMDSVTSRENFVFMGVDHTVDRGCRFLCKSTPMIVFPENDAHTLTRESFTPI